MTEGETSSQAVLQDGNHNRDGRYVGCFLILLICSVAPAGHLALVIFPLKNKKSKTDKEKSGIMHEREIQLTRQKDDSYCDLQV